MNEKEKAAIRAKVRAAGLCEWFARCVRPANGTLAHPILGDVPICDECRAWYQRMSE